MSKNKTKKKKQEAKFALRRLAEDEDVHAHLRTAAIRAREAWGRATGRPGSKVVEDKKFYDKVREAATSLAQAGRKLRPEPEPPKHRGRNAMLVAAGAGGAAYALKKRRSNSAGDSSTSPAEAELQARETTAGVTG